MKRISLIILSIILALALASCDTSSEQPEIGDGKTHGTMTDNVDLDLSSLDAYNTLVAFMTNPSDYTGKTIKVKATSSVLYNFSANSVTHIMLGYDPTACCNAYYPISTSDGIYPPNDTETVFEGMFESDGYIDVSGYSASDSEPRRVDIDALDMSASELKDFIDRFSSEQASSEFYGKSIRIFGHFEQSGGYYYFFGLDESGRQTWAIEAYEPTGSVKIPIAAQYVLNPVELIGTLSVYYENGIAYPCISVTDANHVEGIFS